MMQLEVQKDESGGLSIIIDQFPPKYKNLIFSFGPRIAESLEEVRIKAGAPIYLYSKGREYRTEAVLAPGDVEGILASMLSYSVYSYQAWQQQYAGRQKSKGTQEGNQRGCFPVGKCRKHRRSKYIKAC